VCSFMVCVGCDAMRNEAIISVFVFMTQPFKQIAVREVSKDCQN
jgi:hypothetical protein